MPPNADELVSGVTKRPDRRPVITLAQLKEHRKPDDVWIGSSRPAATSPPQIVEHVVVGHSFRAHCWLARAHALMPTHPRAAIDGKVYDLSQWAASHPGGEHLLVIHPLVTPCDL